MSVQVNAWKCEYCSKTSVNRGAITAHENACKKNPARKHCGTCKHGCLAVSKTPQDPFNPFSKYTYWCDKHQKPMSEKPWFIDCDVEVIDEWQGVLREIPMPGTCHGYKYKGYYGFNILEELMTENKQAPPFMAGVN